MSITAQIIAPPQVQDSQSGTIQVYIAKSDAGSVTVTDVEEATLGFPGFRGLGGLVGTVVPGSGNVTVSLPFAAAQSGTPNPLALSLGASIRTSDLTVTVPGNSPVTITAFNELNASQLPSAPQSFAAATGSGASGTLALTWAAPASLGVNPVTGSAYTLSSYTAIANPGGVVKSGIASGATSATFTGLTAGATYSVTLYAINPAGQGTASPASSAAAHS